MKANKIRKYRTSVLYEWMEVTRENRQRLRRRKKNDDPGLLNQIL